MTRPTDTRLFSPGVERALRTALEAHAGQTRKSPPDVPYVTHPVHVAMLLARLGVDEEVIQAGLLHDVVEDCDDWTAARLRAEFGERVAGLVAEVTEDKSRSWRERKQAAIDHAARLSPAAAVLKGCDKLHNLESLGGALRAVEDRDALWEEFNGSCEETLAMARDLVEALAPRVPSALGDALRAALREVESAAR